MSSRTSLWFVLSVCAGCTATRDDREPEGSDVAAPTVVDDNVGETDAAVSGPDAARPLQPAASADAQAGKPPSVSEAGAAAPTPSDAGAVYPALEASQLGTPQLVVRGFSLAEGALWEHCTGTLLFTDVDAARVHRLTPPNMVSLHHADSNYANGLAFDPSGALWRAEMGGGPAGSRVAKVDRSGMRQISIEKTAAGGTFHNPDDLVFRSDGTLYFTDPTFEHGPHLANSLLSRPVYRVTPESQGHQVIKETEFPGPNGIELSPDEKKLYITSYHGDELASYDVAPDGALSNRKSLRRGLNHADSLCVDVAGNLYVGVDRGLRVLRPDGSVVGTIAVASPDGVTNCEFGGDDGKTLYVTAWTSIWKVTDLPYPGAQWQRHKSLPCP